MIGGKVSLLTLIASLQTSKVIKWATNSEAVEMDEREDDVAIENGANVVSSKRLYGSHAVLIDLDLPAYLVPSSTPGHSHLYIDVNVSQNNYWDLLDVLARCGIVQPGYVAISKKRGATFLRLPWVKKGVAA